MSTATMTREERLEWLEDRQSGIGGSDAAAILGLNPYKGPRDVYEEKIGPVRDKEPNAAMKRGLVLEPVAADLYAERTGRDIRRQPMRRHPEHEFMLGNVDRQILATSGVDSTGVLEIKCPGVRSMAQVKAHGLPDHYIVQLQHYLAVYGYEWGSFCLFNAENWDLIHFDLEADPDLITTLIEREGNFWRSHVEPRIPPAEEADGGEVDVPEVEGELTVVEDPAWEEAAEDLREARELKDAAKEMEAAAKERLQEMMEDRGAEAVEVPGRARLYYRSYSGRTSWKKTALEIAREADLDVDDFKVTGKPYRRFTPYFYDRQEG